MNTASSSAAFPIAFVPLTTGNYALVEPIDWHRVMAAGPWRGLKWASHQYAVNSQREYMHRLILKVPPGKIVDHWNGNGLDNRRANLRPATPTQNMRNSQKRRVKASSRFKGIYWNKANRKWMVRIGENWRQRYLGLFVDEMEAALAYDRAARELFAEFAALNFPQPGEMSALPTP